MRQRLLLLNLVLLVAIAAAGWQLRRFWVDAHARKSAVLAQKSPPAPPPPVVPASAPTAVAATSYADIAQKLLLAKDRNPQVVIEVAAVVEKPLPPLPAVHGVMNLGDGPTVVMSSKTGAAHHAVHPGESIGDYKLVSVDGEEIVLAWEDKTVRKKLEELIVRRVEKAPEEASRTGGQSAPTTTPPPATPPRAQAQGSPGVPLSDGIHACLAGDNSPAGTVSGSLKKVIEPSPFGPRCRWVPAQ